jgi:hypothetical protein
VARTKDTTIWAEVDPTDLAHLNAIVRQMAEETTRDLPRVVTRVCREWAKRALSATPIAPRYATWAEVALAEGGTVEVELPHRWVGDGQLSRINTPGRGYAKAGWRKALQRLGLAVGAQHGMAPGGIVDRRKARDPSVWMWNETNLAVPLDQGGPVPHVPGRPPGADFVSARHIRAKANVRAVKRIKGELDRAARRYRSRWR